MRNPCEIAVIGGGVAGLSAAGHAARLGRSVTLFEGSGLYGGQVATVGAVDGLPTAGAPAGQDVAIGLLDALRGPSVRVVERSVARLETDAQLILTDDTGESYRPDAVIVASGARLRRLDVPGEQALAGRGVSHCATCDGPFFRGQDVVVVGGGDSAAQEALVLSGLCRRVHMVCRSAMRAKRIYVDKLAAKANVRFEWDCEVTAVLGDDAVTGVQLRNRRDGSEARIDCAGVFPFIGVVPNSRFLPPALLTGTGHLGTGPDLATADRRILAAGAIRAGYGGQIAQAAAEGIGAAEAAAGRPATTIPSAVPRARQTIEQES